MPNFDVIGQIEIPEETTISEDYIGPHGRRHRLVRPVRVPAGTYIQRFELPIAENQDVELIIEHEFLTFRGVS